MKQSLKKAIVLLLLLTAFSSLKAQTEVGSFDFCSEEAWGFINLFDSTKSIPAMYCSANGFSEGLAAVKKGRQWGFIDKSNKVVLDFQFDYARNFRGDRAIVNRGEFYGVINKTGKFVIPPRYYDLMHYELENSRYYISRDSTFFQGLIDSVGREVLPHQYTYIITYQSNLGKQGFYKNIPFYTVFQTVDPEKGTFYEQFREDSYQFSPEKGRHDIYDLQFDKLASRNSVSYRDGFQHEELDRIDNFLEENTDLAVDEKVREVANVLQNPPQDTLKALGPNKGALGVMNHDEIESYLADRGYHLFTNKEGEIGLKKGTNIVVPAENTFFRLLNGVISLPMASDIPYLQENYAGTYRSEEKGIFDFFFIAAGDSKKGHVYTLTGKKILTLEKLRMALAGITKVGFKYFKSIEESTNQYGLVNWNGEVILPPVYKEIKITRTGQLIVKQENIVKEVVEEYAGLYTETGKAVIPIGVYSEIKSFRKVDDLYLAIQHNPDPPVKKTSMDENKDYVVLKVSGNSFTVINRFSANLIFKEALDMETGMLPYRQLKR